MAMFSDGNGRNQDFLTPISNINLLRTESYFSFFTNRGVKLWNALPLKI